MAHLGKGNKAAKGPGAVKKKKKKKKKDEEDEESDFDFDYGKKARSIIEDTVERYNASKGGTRTSGPGIILNQGKKRRG